MSARPIRFPDETRPHRRPRRDRTPLERCDSCGRADQGVAMCCGCYRNRCDRKKCAELHAACFTPDEAIW